MKPKYEEKDRAGRDIAWIKILLAGVDREGNEKEKSKTETPRREYTSGQKQSRRGV